MNEASEVRFPNYTARVLREMAPGRYEVAVVEHAADGRSSVIGTYARNGAFLRTFCHVPRGDRHFALYAPELSATRVLEILPGQGIRDIGGEEAGPGGFCPAEFHVPDVTRWLEEGACGPGRRVRDFAHPLGDLPSGCHAGEILEAAGGFDGKSRRRLVTYPNVHGFVAGWVADDDSAWKIQYLDLSRISEGVITRAERFGYVALPYGVPLAQAVDTVEAAETWESPDGPCFYLAVQVGFHVGSGRRVEVERG